MFFQMDTSRGIWLRKKLGLLWLTWQLLKPHLANLVSYLRASLAVIVMASRLTALVGLNSFLGYFFIGPFTFWGTVIGGAADALDGIIARHFRITSRYGEWLDRTIDKFYFATNYAFVWVSIIDQSFRDPSVGIVIILLFLLPLTALEITLFYLGYIGRKNGWPVKSAKSGKWKMVVESTGGCWWSLFREIGPFGHTLSSSYFIWPMIAFLLAANILAALSLHRYIMLYWPSYNDYWKQKRNRAI